MKPIKRYVAWPYYGELNKYGSFEIEAMYQAFKERLIAELRVNSDELFNPAELVDKEPK